MKTPCLKCGLIHDEPTAICDGYAGIDLEETAVDSRKKAAERIRTVLAAVPIENRRGGRARAAAASATTTGASSASGLRPVSGTAAPPPPEVPEWRREVSERLETYRNRRERQSRERATNQSVLAFRVHSKTDAIEAPPRVDSPGTGEPKAPAAEPAAASAAAAEFSVAPAALDAVGTVATAAAAEQSTIVESLRTYQPVEELDPTGDLESVPDVRPSKAFDEEETVRTTASALAAVPVETVSEALPIPAEPAVVHADSATLEVHADPVELAEVQSVAASLDQRVAEPEAIFSIPSIDTDYWHSSATREGEEAECGSLTSGFEAAAHHDAKHEAEAALPSDAAEEHVEGAEQRETALIIESESLASEQAAHTRLAPEAGTKVAEPNTEEPVEDAVLSAAAFQDADGEETENRRAALRTAARPQPGTAPERIEIRVPQPVFDFSPGDVQIQQPHVERLPVADLRERRCAALFDAVILAFTVAGFFLAFHMAGGEFAFTRAGAAVSLATAFLIYSQYVLLFTMVGGATPGMVLRGLRVVCFDGKQPVSAELAWRSFGYLLSAAGGMLGFIWSAWDEHGLSWHDRISQTYITYAEPEPLVAAATQ